MEKNKELSATISKTKEINEDIIKKLENEKTQLQTTIQSLIQKVLSDINIAK